MIVKTFFPDARSQTTSQKPRLNSLYTTICLTVIKQQVASELATNSAKRLVMSGWGILESIVLEELLLN